MKKIIEVTISLTSENEFAMEFYEPMSDDYARICGHDADGIDLDKKIAAELRSWVGLMREE